MRVLLALALAGCFSWAQSEPPDQADWDRPGLTCGAEFHPAIAAAVVAGLAFAGSVAIYATTEPDNGTFPGEDFEERIWGGLLVPIGIGYAIDGLNARSDANRCRRYLERQRVAHTTPPR
jgi:hypothetical protein